MVALSKPVAEVHSSRRPISSLAIVAAFSLVGLVLSLALARHGIDISAGM